MPEFEFGTTGSGFRATRLKFGMTSKEGLMDTWRSTRRSGLMNAQEFRRVAAEHFGELGIY